MFIYRLAMVKKIKGEYFLNRTETIEYLMTAYQLKWCNTKWVDGLVVISSEDMKGVRSRVKVPAYKSKKSSTVRFRKKELDYEFLRRLG